MEARTLEGKTMSEVREYLGRTLPPKAYKPIAHRSYLTEINPMFLRESLSDCFGSVGWGWWTVVTRELIEPQDNKDFPWYGEMRIELFYALYSSDNQEYLSRPITGFGGHASRDREYALKGAFTSALGAAAKELLWQVRVYKGEDVLKKSPKIDATFSHTISFGGDKNDPPKDFALAPNGNRPPLAIDELKRKINLKVEYLGDYTATSFAAEEHVRQGLPKLFPDSDDAGADAELILQFLFDVDNISDLYDAQVEALRSWIGNDMAPVAMGEAEAIVARALIEETVHPEPVVAAIEPAAEESSDIDLSDVDGLLEDTLG